MAFGLKSIAGFIFRDSRGEDIVASFETPSDDDVQDAPLTREEKFVLEALEPRILLSADPISGELARIADDALNGDPGVDQLAIIEVLETVAEARNEAAEQAPEPAEPAVDWPEGWAGDGPETRDTDGVTDVSNSIGDAVSFVVTSADSGAAKIALMELLGAIFAELSGGDFPGLGSFHLAQFTKRMHGL